MKKIEKELFKNLCSFKKEKLDERLLEGATPNILGHLFFNRMQAIAYGVLEKNNLLSNVNREIRNSLKSAFEQNKKQNESFFRCVRYISGLLEKCDCKYAVLKGAYLCGYYPIGYRTSNDIDLLVAPNDVTEIGNILLSAGFRQGNIRGGKFVPATRREIIESKMLRGETVPYIKEINLPQMRFLEVDINFSLDYKNGNEEVINEMLDSVTERTLNGIRIKTFSQENFFIHLCNHLYKEATTMPWVEMMRDMTLYKYCDIYLLLNDLPQIDTLKIFNQAKKLEMEKICAFAVLHASELFELNNTYAVALAKEILKDDPDFIHTVILPKDKREFVYIKKNVFDRLFVTDRKKILKEKR